VARWNPPPEEATVQAARQWIAGAERHWEQSGSVDLVMDQHGVVAGEVGLRNRTDAPARAELGVWVLAPYRGRGLARGAVGAVTRWALAPEAADGLGLDQLWARTNLENPAALRLFETLGWNRLGVVGGMAIWSRAATLLD
jgi:RimJ/RimL family protein N-acetyltransferase